MQNQERHERLVKIVKDQMVAGYMRAIALAEANGMDVEDFKALGRETLLGLFLSVNDVGMDEQPGAVRLAELERRLREFMENGMTTYDRILIDEENGERASALRLCEQKSLTSQNGAGEMDSAAATKETL